MNQTYKLSQQEVALCALGLLALLVAIFAPAVAQPANAHDFADRRVLLGLPFAMDVLSNLPFAFVGLLIAWRLSHAKLAIGLVQRVFSAVFLVGLLVTAVASSGYHLQPDDTGLLWDRVAMAVAFAGVMALAVAGRLGDRAGLCVGLGLLVLAPAAALYWAATANILPWAIAQFGGMALILWMSFLAPLPGALRVRWGAVIACYAVAKVFEVADHPIYELTGQMLSGHTLKHVAASFAAWPVVAALREAAQAAQARQNATTA